MNKLALDLLRLTDDSDIRSIEVKTSGANSKIAKCTTVKNVYCLKEYNALDARNRQRREKSFLLFCNNSGIKRIPNFINQDPVHHITLMDWIEGKKVKKLGDSEIEQIGQFITELIMHGSRSIQNLDLEKASEAYMSIDDIKKTAQARINQCDALASKKGIPKTIFYALQSAKEQINKELVEFCGSRANKKLWAINTLKPYISPSDVGIHNIIKNGDTVNFIDFEYAGYDDISKQVADWVLQPNNTFTLKQEAMLITIINGYLKGHDDFWLERYKSIKKLTILKWIIIMLKHNKTSDEINMYQEATRMHHNNAMI